MNERVDTHVHIFRRDAQFVAGRRYAPDYDAAPETLRERMDEAGVGRAILVQPSFLGFDNSYLLAAIAAAPEAFAGVAVVEPRTETAELAALQRAGIVGLRLNCIGRPTPDFAGAEGGLARRLAGLGMALQIQAEGAQWRAMEPFLSDPPGRVVIDHFGRAPADAPDGGFESLTRAAARTDRLWFKFSGPYRMQARAARECAAALLAVAGPGRIVWGSDWPHTQFEGGQSYHETLDWLADWVAQGADREAILRDNPQRLFGDFA